MRRCPRPLAVALTALVLATTALPGCLDEEEPDLSDWHLGLSVERFETNGARAINQTHFRLDVRFGPIFKDDWIIAESDGFTKGEDDEFPLRIEASYLNGTVYEPFPIQGSSTVATGLLRVGGGTLKVIIDGDASTYSVGKEYDMQPHDYEASAHLKGPYGDLVLYFLMLQPKD